MLLCPNDQSRLHAVRRGTEVHFRCDICDGVALTVPLVRRRFGREAFRVMWAAAKRGDRTGEKRCVYCHRPMAEIETASEAERAAGHRLDFCVECQFVWFDRGELDKVIPAEPDDDQRSTEASLSPAGRAALAVFQAARVAEREEEKSGDAESFEWWHVLPAFLGIPVEYNAPLLRRFPWLVLLVIAGVSLVSMVGFSDLHWCAARFGLVPKAVIERGGITLITSFFFHVGWMHLIINMGFLWVFGNNLEDHLGRGRFALLLAASTVGGALLHLALDPHGDVPVIGASAGVSGVVACYVFLFPRVRLGMLVGYAYYFRWVRIPVTVAFGVWLLLQLSLAYFQLKGITLVSALGHLGGAAVGILLWWWWRRDLIPATAPSKVPSGLEYPTLLL